MNGHDDTFLDSVAVLALGALPEAEAREVAAHVATCGTCRREYDEFRSTANLVGYSAEATAAELDDVTAARMKNAVMRAVRATASDGMVPPTLASAGSRGRAQLRTWLPYGAVAAALVFAVLSASNDASLRSQHERDAQRIASLESRTKVESATVAAERARVAAENARVAALKTRSRHQSFALENADARLATLFAPESKSYAVRYGQVVKSGGRLFLALPHLAPPPAGKVYQAWTVGRGLKGVAPSVTFVPGAGGMTIVELPEDARRIVAVALTLEPAGGSKIPTSKPAFLRPLS